MAHNKLHEAPARTRARCCSGKHWGERSASESYKALKPQPTCEAACLQHTLRADAGQTSHHFARRCTVVFFVRVSPATATSTAAIIRTVTTVTIIGHISHLHRLSEHPTNQTRKTARDPLGLDGFWIAGAGIFGLLRTGAWQLRGRCASTGSVYGFH